MFEEIKNILVSELDVDPDAITPDSQLSGDLGINSLELADLVLLCEDKFGVAISDDDIRSFVTVNDVITYLEKNSK